MMGLRAPYLFFNPRFWAEEGSVYFSYAFHSVWYEALIAGHQGYYSFFPNFMTVIAAHVVFLEYAPLVTTLAAFSVQILVILIVMYRLKSILYPMQQFLICATVLFVCHTGEVWLNTITTQFHLCLASFFIILAEHQKVNRWWSFFDRTVLFISGLTGVMTIFLFPALLTKWVFEKSRNLLILNLIIFTTTFFQISRILFDGLRSNRIQFDKFGSILELWIKQFVLWPILGNSPGYIPSNEKVLYLAAGTTMVLSIVATFKSKHINSKLALISFFSVSMLSLAGSLGMAGGWRYVYAPAVMLITFFILNLRPNENKIITGFSGMIVILSLISWIPLYHRMLSPWVVQHGVVWSEEVSKWRKTDNYQLKIWPQWEGKRKWSICLQPQ